MCQKITYASKGEAIKDIAYIRAQRKRFSNRGVSPKSGRKLRPYECSRCGKWHLTTAKRIRAKQK